MILRSRIVLILESLDDDLYEGHRSLCTASLYGCGAQVYWSLNMITVLHGPTGDDLIADDHYISSVANHS